MEGPGSRNVPDPESSREWEVAAISSHGILFHERHLKDRVCLCVHTPCVSISSPVFPLRVAP